MRVHPLHKFKKFGDPTVRIRSNEKLLEDLVRVIDSDEKRIDKLKHIFAKKQGTAKLKKEYVSLNKTQLVNINRAIEKTGLMIVDILCFLHKNRIAFKWVARVIKRDKESEKHLTLELDEVRADRTKVLHNMFLHAKSVQRRVLSRELLKEFSFQKHIAKLRKIRHRSVELDTAYKHILALFRKPKKINELITYTKRSFHVADDMALKSFQLVHILHKRMDLIPNKKETEKKVDSILKELVTQTRRAYLDIK